MKLERPPTLSTAPDTVTRPARGPVARRPATRRHRRRRVSGRRLWVPSKLTLRVLAINMLALMVLVGGVLYLGRYEERLIQAEFASLRSEALIFAGALAEAAVVAGPDDLLAFDPEQARRMVRRVYETTDTRTLLFDQDGLLLADSRYLVGPGGIVEIAPPRRFDDNSLTRTLFNAIYGFVTETLPERKRWPPYIDEPNQSADDVAAVSRALNGELGQQIWSRDDGSRVLGVTVPVQRLRVVMGAVLVTNDTELIEQAVQSVREDILEVFAVAFGITVLLSLYLAGTITRPIRQLAGAAEQVRSGQGRGQEIPDFTHRRDEIGDLSGALREMTAALWMRMDAIESFAADVAHEIKNPLSSLRSAVETTARITDPERQRRLMAVIQEDVQRLDRLITDISDASRLDAELSRARAERVDLGRMLEMLAELYTTTRKADGPTIELDLTADALIVPGLEDRLVQVFRNLITNALSFSPPHGRIVIQGRKSGGFAEIAVENDGPIIPESKLEAIFDRFYSERPVGEKFGTHSGLGLSISKQIVEAHGGQIFARNREDGAGARFVVRIPVR
ncbi:MAG: stimulus-sensing domain-containing protein [Inquilinaceae bacterium]